MFNFGWAELMVIGIVALIVIGPEDLPDMFRQLGRFTAKLRSMSREFSRAMEQAAKDSGVKEAANDLKTATSSKALGLDAVKSAADKFEKWDPMKNTAKPSATMTPRTLFPPPMPEMAKTVVTVDDAAEAAEDLAAEDLAAEPAVAHGPATQALYDKQALRARVMQEQSAKLKAIEDGTYQDAPSILPPAKKKRAIKAVATEAVVTPKRRKTTAKAEKA